MPRVEPHRSGPQDPLDAWHSVRFRNDWKPPPIKWHVNETTSMRETSAIEMRALANGQARSRKGKKKETRVNVPTPTTYMTTNRTIKTEDATSTSTRSSKKRRCGPPGCKTLNELYLVGICESIEEIKSKLTSIVGETTDSVSVKSFDGGVRDGGKGSGTMTSAKHSKAVTSSQEIGMTMDSVAPGPVPIQSSNTRHNEAAPGNIISPVAERRPSTMTLQGHPAKVVSREPMYTESIASTICSPAVINFETRQQRQPSLLQMSASATEPSNQAPKSQVSVSSSDPSLEPPTQQSHIHPLQPLQRPQPNELSLPSSFHALSESLAFDNLFELYAIRNERKLLAKKLSVLQMQSEFLRIKIETGVPAPLPASSSTSVSSTIVSDRNTEGDKSRVLVQIPSTTDYLTPVLELGSLGSRMQLLHEMDEELKRKEAALASSARA